VLETLVFPRSAADFPPHPKMQEKNDFYLQVKKTGL
jgi:hypothetical protein